jgi:hypothetical protein
MEDNERTHVLFERLLSLTRPLNVAFVEFPDVDEKLASVTWDHEILEVDICPKRQALSVTNTCTVRSSVLTALSYLYEDKDTCAHVSNKESFTLAD